MANKYVKFVSDQHFISCVSNLYTSYIETKSKVNLKKFYKNKIDVFKLIFDSKFNNIDEEELIDNEILRQVDKSVNNAVGTFHEELLGGVEGYQSGRRLGFDLKAVDNSLFAEIKNKHNTMNSSSAESAFQKLASFADKFKCNCYLAQIWAKNSFCNHWVSDINGKEYSHSRVYIISGDQFYSIITGEKDALYQVYNALPEVINDFLIANKKFTGKRTNVVMEEISVYKKLSERDLFDQIAHDNFNYYLGFKDL
jgi:hypothetical protein